MPKEFLTTASSEFLNLQTGNAAPYFYIEAIVSGVTALIGESYTSTNFVVDAGTIDRQKPVFPGDRSNIFSSDVTVKAANNTQRFSPDVTGSIFYSNEYLKSPVNYWGGFVNISGTALLLQRGSFLLDNLRLDSRQGLAYIRLVDKFKKALEARIGISLDASGTALQFIITGIQDGGSAIQSLLITGATLTAGDLSTQTAGINFDNLSLSEQTVADAVALVAEASDGYIFTNRLGVLRFVSNQPVFGTASSADFTIRESDWSINTFWEQSKDDRISKVSVSFQSGTSVSIISEATGITANTITISNDVIQSTADAIAFATRIRDRFSGQITRLEIDSIYAPSLEIGNIIAVHATSLGLIGNNFEIYRMQEDITNGEMRIFLLNASRLTGKWAFASHQTGAAAAGEHSAVFAGSGASQSGAWQAGWGFAGRDAETGTNPSFDADGNNNNAINTAVTSSGAGGTGIEVLFEAY